MNCDAFTQHIVLPCLTNNPLKTTKSNQQYETRGFASFRSCRWNFCWEVFGTINDGEHLHRNIVLQKKPTAIIHLKNHRVHFPDLFLQLKPKHTWEIKKWSAWSQRHSEINVGLHRKKDDSNSLRHQKPDFNRYYWNYTVILIKGWPHWDTSFQSTTKWSHDNPFDESQPLRLHHQPRHDQFF